MKVLYFYPNNPLDYSQGNNRRALSLLEYFKNKNIYLDFVGETSSTFDHVEIAQLEADKLVTKGFLLPRSKNSGINYLLKISLPRMLSDTLKAFDRRGVNQQNVFNSILKNNSYDFIIISYSCWVVLVKDNPYLKKAKILVDTHDLLTSQFKNKRKFDLGTYISTEMKLLDIADRIWAISSDEKYIYEQFLTSTVDLIPHTLEAAKSENVPKDIDIIYVASNNEHNRKGATWFFENVYPNLSKSLSITVVGKICEEVPDFVNLTKLEYVENLTDIYNRSRISLCPMFSGTGLKIKVVEALSHSIPVVCNERGVDGLLNKTKNGCLVTNSANEFREFIERLLNDSDFYALQSKLARDFYSKTLSKEHVYGKLDSIFCL
ncbi:MAG: glycosyltransferase [Aquaticitalea sp.]